MTVWTNWVMTGPDCVALSAAAALATVAGLS